MAAYDGFKKACLDAGPALLVPIMSLTVTVPNEFLGEIIADLHSRKCQITNMAAQDKITVISQCPPHEDVRLLYRHPVPLPGQGGLYHVFLPLRQDRE